MARRRVSLTDGGGSCFRRSGPDWTSGGESRSNRSAGELELRSRKYLWIPTITYRAKSWLI